MEDNKVDVVPGKSRRLLFFVYYLLCIFRCTYVEPVEHGQTGRDPNQWNSYLLWARLTYYILYVPARDHKRIFPQLQWGISAIIGIGATCFATDLSRAICPGIITLAPCCFQ